MYVAWKRGVKQKGGGPNESNLRPLMDNLRLWTHTIDSASSRAFRG